MKKAYRAKSLISIVPLDLATVTVLLTLPGCDSNNVSVPFSFSIVLYYACNVESLRSLHHQTEQTRVLPTGTTLYSHMLLIIEHLQLTIHF